MLSRQPKKRKQKTIRDRAVSYEKAFGAGSEVRTRNSEPSKFHEKVGMQYMSTGMEIYDIRCRQSRQEILKLPSFSPKPSMLSSARSRGHAARAQGFCVWYICLWNRKYGERNSADADFPKWLGKWIGNGRFRKYRHLMIIIQSGPMSIAPEHWRAHCRSASEEKPFRTHQEIYRILDNQFECNFIPLSTIFWKDVMSIRSVVLSLDLEAPHKLEIFPPSPTANMELLTHRIYQLSSILALQGRRAMAPPLFTISLTMLPVGTIVRSFP
jgi:hypothetical protein